MATTTNRVKYLIEVIDQASRNLKRVATESETAGKGLKRADKAAKGTSEQLEGLKFSAQAAGGKVGEMAGRVENAGRALAVFAANPATLAAASLGILATGAVAAGAATAAAMVTITRSAGDAAKRLQELQDRGGLSIVSADDIDAVQQANAALDGVWTTIDGLTVAIGAELAPHVEWMADTLASVGYAALDAFEAAADATDLVKTAFASVAEYISRPLIPIGMMLQALIKLNEYMGVEVDPTMRAFADSLANGTAVSDAFGAVTELVAEKLSGYESRVRATKKAQQELNEETAKSEEVFQRVAGVLEDKMGKGGDLDVAALMANKLGYTLEQEMSVKGAKAADDLKASVEGLNAELEGTPVSMAAIGSAATMLVGAIGTIGSAMEQMAGGNERALRTAFAVQKAATLASIVLSTAEAAMHAFKIGTAIGGPPVGAAMSAVAVAAGAAQFAAAASTSFDSASIGGASAAGGMAGGRGAGGFASFFDAPQGATAPAGGTSSQGGGYSPVVIDHQVFEAGLQRSKRSGGMMGQAQRSGRSGINTTPNRGA